MLTLLVLLASTSLQMLASFLALRLARFTKGRWGWVLLGVGLSLMVLRRIGVLLEYVRHGPPPRVPHPELVALVASILVFISFFGIRSYVEQSERDAAFHLEAEGRQQAERALQEREQELDRFFSLTLDLLCIADLEGRFLRLNPAWENTLGFPLAELEGKPFLDFVHPEDRDATLAAVGQLSTGRDVIDFTNRYRCRDGGYRWIEWRSAPSGGFIYAAARDISERRRAEEALASTLAELEDLYNHAPCGYHSLDELGIILRINDTELEWLGYSREEVVGRMCFRDLLAPESVPTFEEHFPHFKARGFVNNLRFHFLRKDGSRLPVLLNATAVYAGQRRYLMSRSTTQDITDLERAEALLLQHEKDLMDANQALAAKNAELDEFTYVASHDLQEPLRKLVSFSELLPRDLSVDLPERAAKDLHFIVDAGRRMQAMVQDLLTLSRAGRTALRFALTPLDECLDEALDALSLKVQETGAQVERVPLPVLRVDRRQVVQLFQNLLGNALKFTCPGEAPRMQITCARGEAGWVLGVRDEGIGIEPRHFEQIFAPFKRLHGRTEYEGSGVGLAVCRKAVERHGGRIWVESEPGRGAWFRFTLPNRTDDSQS